MSAAKLELEPDLVEALNSLNQPLEKAARELMVLELYRRALISGGKAAQLLGLSRAAFMAHAASLGIPSFDLSPEELRDEASRLRAL